MGRCILRLAKRIVKGVGVMGENYCGGLGADVFLYGSRTSDGAKSCGGYLRRF